ncbi:MAG: polysaccharide biosynthesis protein [Clostridium sp.]|uniref:polysaccharide biosynthesis protein n=1 Tax=Clostridium sp. TaxID=1506 RepID=UPI002FC6AC6E
MKNKIILVTGGTGSWGVELVKQLIDRDAKEIRVLARNEFLQYEMSEIFKNSKVKGVIGDIRDKDLVRQAMVDVDIVFHLAALKHVPICEEQPFEAIKTNVIGTENIVDCAIAENVDKVIYLSTDKVSEPSSTYGLTKAIGEKIVINANSRKGNTKFSVLRSGNVLGSNGSVIPLFKKELEEGKDITLTHRDMNRFFVSLNESVDYLIDVCEVTKGGEIFIMKMPSFKIVHIAEIMLEACGTGTNKIIEVGPRPGEKLDEVLITKEEGEKIYDFSERFYAILPNGYKEKYNLDHIVKRPIGRYSSDKAIIEKSKVREILLKNNYIA